MQNNKNIIDRIDNDLQHINQMIDWSSKFLKKEKGKTRSGLIDKRRQLNKIKNALQVNPAASIYGESQVGKSYLVDNLLSDSKGALKFVFKEVEYDFITDFNPQGDGAESTSIVSRFTTKNNIDNNSEYPILAKMLSAKDIILVIIDSYFNDIARQKFTSVDKLSNKADEVENQYKGRNANVQNYLTEDDLYDIRDYMLYGTFFYSGYNEAEAIAKSGFFEKVGRYIDCIPVKEWTDLFAILWGQQDFITEIFEKLLQTLQKLNFQKEVLIKVDAVLRDKGTILDVTRIRELFGESDDLGKGQIEKDMDVKLNNTNVVIPKSSFCALTSELVFEVKEELKQEKEFLNSLDFLDFPGARGRLGLEIDKAQNRKSDLVLRGKIAYLFNDYSINYLISNLLFCHHDVQSNINSTLSKLLSNWVKIVIGKTAKERQVYLQDSQIPPLFLVATKFNTDMKKTVNDDVDSDSKRLLSMNNRWDRRFEKVLTDIIGGKDENSKKTESNDDSWFFSWTDQNHNFNNIYLLRSFDWSDRTGIFEGYNKVIEGKRTINLDEQGNKIGEQSYAEGYKEFLSELKDSFLQNSFIKNHFEDPLKYWEEAATIGKDGSELIIKNLTIAANSTSKTRLNSFLRQIEGIETYFKQVLKNNFHDDSADALIKAAKQKAGRIEIQLDALFGRDRFFFSQFISRMLISESKVHDLLLETINDMQIIEDTDTSVYFAIRKKANIDPILTKEENIERMRVAYSFDTVRQVEDYCKSISISIDELLKPKVTRNFASIITDVVVKQWFDKYLVTDHYQNFIARGFKEDSLYDLLVHMRTLFSKELHLNEVISNRIRKYVLNPESVDIMVEMLADISSEMINRFVNEMGYSYYSDYKWENIIESNKKNNLELDTDISHIEDKSVYDTESVEKIFDVLNNLDQVLNETPLDEGKINYLPNYSSFERWTKLMKISFIAACTIPTYDRLANEELGKIIQSFNSQPIEAN